MPQSRTVNGVPQTLSGAEYDAWIAESVQNVLAQQALQATEDGQKAVRSQVRAARTRLQQINTATPPFTTTQRDQAIQDIAGYLDKLIGVLIDQRVIEAS